MCGENMITAPVHSKRPDDFIGNVERAKTVFSKYYEYLPYNRQVKESIVSILYSREAGARKNQCFYTRSLCAAKVGSCVQPIIHPITCENQMASMEEKRLRPRQFEYHPSDSGLMAVGTLDGEVVVLNHETGSILSCISPQWELSGILGLCWLKRQPSKLLVGSDNGSLRLYDINRFESKFEDDYCCHSTVIFDDFEQLTSVHVNATEDQCLTSGYSKKVAIYDICTGQQLHMFEDMHREPINVAKFSNHSPALFVTSSFDRDIKMWDSRQKPMQACYTASSSRGNVMAVFSPDDLYLLVSAVDNEVKQLHAADGRLHTDFGIVSMGSSHNYTRSYYMNGRDYIISGSSEEPTIRICCAQTGRRLRDISLKNTGLGSSVFVQSLRSDPFRHFHMAVLAAYNRRVSKIMKVNLLSSRLGSEASREEMNTARPSYGMGG
ncbi:protein DWD HYPERSENSITIVE TO UV-B 1-like [Andrographis paniculata]|uniref:protein DWD HYPERSENSITIVE TO UV-B 1-like n=1 Tax=Andrographis paniculata TaxID=175694 RepID=UPI0021E8BF5C|nr:protein DWD HYPERSENSITIVE TO UV-B 1-like [Andrographis paniculata]XP_051140627.1 protein DWD HYPERSENSITIVE TO UV-B 1-like [Andrographis paniculata]